jgi:hypothetical protein
MSKRVNSSRADDDDPTLIKKFELAERSDDLGDPS